MSQQTLLIVIAAWSLAGMLLGYLGNALPAGAFKNFVLFLAHISPANLQAALQALGFGSTTAKRGFANLGALLFAAAVSGLVLVVLSLANCTQQQAQNGVNAVFSAEQVACMAANTGFLGDSNAVQEFEAACKISPQLEGDIQAFIAALGKIAAPHAGCIGGAK